MNTNIFFIPVPVDPGSAVSANISLSGLAKILALIGTLFAVLNAPSGISQLIGSDLSVSSALQSLQTTMIGTSMLGTAGRMIGSAAKDAGALSTYAAGRALGGSSISQQLISSAQGGKGGNTLVSNRSTFGGIQGGMEAMASSSNHSVMDFASGFVANGLPNIAKPISKINADSGSFRNIFSESSYSPAEKISRSALKMTGLGASKIYSAASDRVASFGHRNTSMSPSMRNMTMMNVISREAGDQK